MGKMTVSQLAISSFLTRLFCAVASFLSLTTIIVCRWRLNKLRSNSKYYNKLEKNSYKLKIEPMNLISNAKPVYKNFWGFNECTHMMSLNAEQVARVRLHCSILLRLNQILLRQVNLKVWHSPWDKFMKTSNRMTWV
jgi:hypothetical protein